MRVSLDQDRCIGSGQCALTASDIFDLREDDGLGVVLEDHPDQARLGDVRTAAHLCPVHAIHVDED